MDKWNRNDSRPCGYKAGRLPSWAPLALSYVPAQQDASPRYESEKALYRGTLFPGLDLPLRNLVNNCAANVPAKELMALDFAAHDLSLYLDTHPNDAEAFARYRELLHLAKEGRKRYCAVRGAVTKDELADAESYTWLKDPWPWDVQTEE